MGIGMVSLFIVLISGLTSDFVPSEAVASRTFSAFSFTSLVCFIFMMSCEEYAIFKTKRELESFIEDATLKETSEKFNRAEYLHEKKDDTKNKINVTETPADNVFRPIDYTGNQNSAQQGTVN